MSKGTLNRVVLVGNLGQDPEVRYTAGGVAVATLSIATVEVWKDGAGRAQERTEWHQASLFGKLAEIAAEYLGKGGKVMVEGRLQTDKWTDPQGRERYTTRVMAERMEMLGRAPADRKSGQAPADKNSGAPKRGKGNAWEAYRGAPEGDASPKDLPF